MNRFRKLEEVLFFIALHIYMADMYLEMSVFNITWNRRILQLVEEANAENAQFVD